MSTSPHRFQARLPKELYQQLELAAQASGCSVNAELIRLVKGSLEHSIPPRIPERRKSDLLRELTRWCRVQGKSVTHELIREFAERYNAAVQSGGEDDDDSEKYVVIVSEVPSINARYLSELHRVWNREHPLQLAEDYSIPGFGSPASRGFQQDEDTRQSNQISELAAEIEKLKKVLSSK